MVRFHGQLAAIAVTTWLVVALLTKATVTVIA